MAHRSVVRIAVLVIALMLAGCVMPDRDAPATVDEPSPAEVEEVVVATPTPPLTVIVTADSNVRQGPGTDHTAHFWLPAGTEITVRGRNLDGTWLSIEQAGREGWIFASLTNLGASAIPGLPEAALPTPAPAVVLVPTATPIPPPVIEPTPEPEPVPAIEPTPVPAAPAWLTVTGNPVNVREGPGTDHPIALRAAAGDQFEVVARNADGSWLQIADPRNPAARLWIYGPLTDAAGALVAGLTLAEAPAPAVRIEEPQPPAAEPAPDPASPPARIPPPPPQAEIEACAQWHRVNANETRLAQITDWYELDLAAVAERNGLDPNAPLTTGMELCLDLGEPGHHVAAPEPPLFLEWYAGSGAAAPACTQCATVPHFPGEAVRSVPGVPVLYHAPGTYDRSLPGLAYDWEWVLSDDSTLWDWTVRDRAACYDALRVHMGDVPEAVGLTRIEYRLSDPFGDSYHELREMGMATYFYFPGIAGGGIPSTPDLARVSIRCYGNTGPTWSRPDSELFCRIAPRQGNDGSIHLEAATTVAMANAVGQVSRQSKWFQGGWDDPENVAYLYPVIAGDIDNPAGPGPCMVVTRAQ